MALNTTKRERFFISMTIVLGWIVIFGGRNLPIVDAKDKVDPKLFKELKVFTDVLTIVQRDYVTDPPPDQLVQGAIKGMLTTLDPHSGYLDPTFYDDLKIQTSGEFGGLGIEITLRDGLLIVVAPMEGSPAEKAGVMSGDAIVKIDGKYTKDFSLVDAVKRLRGPRGSSVVISVQREGFTDLIDIRVVRDTIEVKTVKARYLNDGLGYVRVSSFIEKTADDLQAAIDRLRRSSPNRELQGLILDLRHNPGGLLTQAVRVSDMFLDEGVIVYTDGRVETQKQKFLAHKRGTEPNYPIVVLIDEGSASASEIVSGAMKDHGRAIVVGIRSFGKGSVQTITPLENGGALTLTTALYYTKSGNSLQGEGVTPDIVVEQKRSEAQAALREKLKGRRPEAIREGDLPGAIKNPSHEDSIEEGPGETEEELKAAIADERIDIEKSPITEWVEKDAQFAKAFDLIKSFKGRPTLIAAAVSSADGDLAAKSPTE